jgi:3-phenylpropionate/trans-cinnamate dioxygenase ferredoxin subunit
LAASDRRRSERYVVGKAADVPPGGRLLVNVEGREIGIFNVDGNFYAILNRCPHRGGDLCKGNVVSPILSDGPGNLSVDPTTKLVMCPWHHWEYDLETGQSWCDVASPSKLARRYAVRPLGVDVTSGADLGEESAGEFARLSDAVVIDPLTHRVKGPFTAEVFPVELDDEYIVLDMAGKLRS